MRHGKVVEEGPASELFKTPKTDYTRALFAAASGWNRNNGAAAASKYAVPRFFHSPIGHL